MGKYEVARTSGGAFGVISGTRWIAEICNMPADAHLIADALNRADAENDTATLVAAQDEAIYGSFIKEKDAALKACVGALEQQLIAGKLLSDPALLAKVETMTRAALAAARKAVTA
jgi:hypothetical protein